MQSPYSKNTQQTGMTLIEASVWFVLFALVIAGALKLYSSVSTSQQSSEMSTDVIALNSATKDLYGGTPGGYGNLYNNLVPALIAAKKIPSTIKAIASNTALQKKTVTTYLSRHTVALHSKLLNTLIHRLFVPG